jgi:ribonuclease HII
VTPTSAPYHYEGRAWRSGVLRVAGVDEVGRGPLAGPVVAAAVILDPARRIPRLADSKLLPYERRATLFEEISAKAVAIGVGIVDHLTIDRVNILRATRLAMMDALRTLAVPPELIITDWVKLDGMACPQRNLVDGDARCASVAAASIVAKVTRDRIMLDLDRLFPEYGFARHKGYATADHLAALDRLGPCPFHRRTFSGVWRQGELFVARGVYRGHGPRTAAPGARGGGRGRRVPGASGIARRRAERSLRGRGNRPRVPRGRDLGLRRGQGAPRRLGRRPGRCGVMAQAAAAHATRGPVPKVARDHRGALSLRRGRGQRGR